jgi:hypothetical protein
VLKLEIDDVPVVRLLELRVEVPVVLPELETDEELVPLAGRTHPEIGCGTTFRPDAVPGLTRTISTHRSGRVIVILWERIVRL